MKIKIELPDGSKKEFDKGVTGLEIAKSIGERLAMAALACEIDGKVRDLSTKIEKSCRFKVLTYKDQEGKKAAWHTAEHILTQAMLKLYPDIKMAMGPATEEGFYFDFESEKSFSPEDFPKIEKEIESIIKKDLKIHREIVPAKEAKKLFKGNEYKQEWLKEIEDSKEDASIYWTGDEFVDLCAGPHAPSTGKVGFVKLLSVAGAYWRGDSKNKMLQRIYGISFEDKKDLTAYVTRIEEAKKRDHRLLGKKHELFSIHDEGPGFPFFLPKGLTIKNELIKYWRELHENEGYLEIQTPIVLNRKLWETSKHWFNYKDNMYTFKIDDEDYAIKPMNCPGGMLMYKEKVHSYKELPLRVGELGIVHRHEMSGVLSGLFRVRVFTQDDAHIYMTEAQMKNEVFKLMDLYKKVYEMFGFEYAVELSTRPEKSIGTDAQWEILTNTLREALEEKKMEYKVNEGDGAFYGPKIDFHLKDCIGRTWQCGTIQLDMAQPENFDLTYVGEDGSDNKRPVMLHRVVYGSLERFMGILIEHFAAKFPLWLSPVQVRVMTVSQKFGEHGQKIVDSFSKEGIRAELDNRAESIPKKVREAQLDKIPLMLTIGEKEAEDETLAIRTLDGQIKFAVKTEEFINKLKDNIKRRELKFVV